MRALLLTALTAAAVLSANPACAQSETRSVAVAYADLNVAEDAGRAALKRRIANAADYVCAAGESRELRWMMAERRCVAETIARAEADIGTGVATANRSAGAASGLHAAAR